MELINKINLFSKRFDIKKYLNKNNILFKEIDSPKGKQLNIEKCPFCKNINYKGNIHKNRLYIKSDDKRFLCYNCSEKGNIIKLLSKIENISEKSVIDKYIFGDYIELLPDELKVLILDKNDKKLNENMLLPISLPSSFKEIELGPIHLKPEHRYLSKRGILDPEIITKFDIRFCKFDVIQWGEDDNGNVKNISIKDRIIFPIKFNGEIVGWQGRDITNKQTPSYLINKGFQKQLLLYNYDNLKNEEFITLVEGPIDAIKSHKINGICLFGKYLSDAQERYILKMKNLKKIYLCFDNYDSDALESQDKIAKRLSNFFDIYIINLPFGKDAGDMSTDLMVKYLELAEKYCFNKIINTIK